MKNHQILRKNDEKPPKLYLFLKFFSLVKHLGVIHQLVDKYLPTEFARNALASSDEAANKIGIAEPPKSDDKYSPGSKIAECRLCDRPQFFK